MLKMLAALMLVAGMASAPAPSFAAAGEEILPPANAKVWKAYRLKRDVAPFINGGIAQVRGKGQGRFAVICRRGDAKGFIAYRPPAELREALVEKGEPIEVVFRFEKGDKVQRKLQWNEDGRYWTGPFGPRSRLANLMRKKYRLKVNVKGVPGVESEFTLNGSWRAINRMFSYCGV